MINFDLENKIFLAPMAGVADSAFRKICRENGADICISEMISAKALKFGDKKSLLLASFNENERPIGLQIFGSEIDCMEYAASYLNENFHPEFIDINMGCPAPKIFNNGDGSALLKDILKASKIISAVKSKIGNTPLCVKFRIGVDDKSINATEFSKMCEQSGADFITVHGKTRAQYYKPPVNKEVIKLVCDSVKIPVIANGDISDEPSARKMLEYTGAKTIMIGRAALGDPTIFLRIKHFLKTGEKISKISVDENLDLALKQLEYAIIEKGEFLATREMRKHFAWYVKGLCGASRFKNLCNTINSFDDAKKLVNDIKAIQK